MMQRLKCCLYILMAKRYVVFTEYESKFRKGTSSDIHNSDVSFLSAIVSNIKRLVSNHKEACEQILEDMKK